MHRILAIALLLPIFASAPAHATSGYAWLAIGDSLVYGYAHDAVPMPKRLAAELGVPVVNMGVGGDTAANISARLTAHGLPYPFVGVILEGCTNDLFAGGTASACWTTMEAAADAVRARGMLVVLCTVFPRGNSPGWTAGMETERDAYNTAVRAYVEAHFSEALLFDADEELSDDGHILRPAFDSGDHVHLGGDGMQAFAEGLAALIRTRISDRQLSQELHGCAMAQAAARTAGLPSPGTSRRPRGVPQA